MNWWGFTSQITLGNINAIFQILLWEDYLPWLTANYSELCAYIVQMYISLCPSCVGKDLYRLCPLSNPFVWMYIYYLSNKIFLNWIEFYRNSYYTDIGGIFKGFWKLSMTTYQNRFSSKSLFYMSNKTCIINQLVCTRIHIILP